MKSRLKFSKRALAMLLAVVMVLSIAPISVLAMDATLQTGNIEEVVVPTGATIDRKNRVITATVPYTVSSVVVDIQLFNDPVSDWSPEGWTLYADAARTQPIANRTMTLAVGANTAFIQTMQRNLVNPGAYPEPEVAFNYTLVITRESASTATESGEIATVTVPVGAVINRENNTITATVPHDITSVTVALTVYEDDSGTWEAGNWYLYSDAARTNRIADRTLALAVGANTAYITSWSAMVMDPAVGHPFHYTLVITRASESGIDIPLHGTPREQAASIVSQMTFEEKMGQILFISAAGWGVELSTANIELLEEAGLGGICLFGANVAGTVPQAVTLTRGMQEAAIEGSRFDIPLILSIDQEGGRIVRFGAGNTTGFLATTMPGNLAVGATFDTDIAYDVGHVLGREVRAIGMNMNFAPTVDVNSNPLNQVIGDRSFGSNPAAVGRLAAAYTRGMEDAGVLATPKHFPGHGNVAVDSHFGIDTVPGDRNFLFANDLVPFQAAIDAGASMIMTAHLLVPGLDDTLVMPTNPSSPFYTTGMYPIATFSYEIMTNVLRNDMGFEGLVVTDALNMAAVTQSYLPFDAVELTILAGVDLPLMPVVPSTTAGISGLVAEMRTRAEANPALMDRIEEAAERVIAFKIDKDIYCPAAFVAGEVQPILADSTLAEQIAYAESVIRSPEHLAVEQLASDRAISITVNNEYDGEAVLPRTLEAGDVIYLLSSNNAEVRNVDDATSTLRRAMESVIENAGLTGQVTLVNQRFTDAVNGLPAGWQNNIRDADHVIIGSGIVPAWNAPNPFVTPATSVNYPNAPTAGEMNIIRRNNFVREIWDFIEAEEYGYKSVNLAMAMPYELALFNQTDTYVSALVNVNTRANANVATHTVSPIRAARPTPIYFSAVYAIFGDITPTGRQPVDVPVICPDGLVVEGEFIVRAGYRHGRHQVTFRWNYPDAPIGGVFTTVEATPGETITRPAHPERAGYVFDRWTTDAAGENLFSFRLEEITEDVTLYAQWLSADPTIATGDPYEVARDIAAQMNFEELMGQLLFIGVAGWGNTLSQANIDLIEEAGFGGLCLFGANVNGTIDQLVTLTRGMQEASVRGSRFNIPLMLSVDQEGGWIVRFGASAIQNSFLGTTMPGNMALGAAADPELAYDVGYVLGAEVRALGMNMNFAPTVDINTDPRNPIIGVRSFSSCPELSSILGAAYTAGMEDAGVLATAKHFPGHGNTSQDSHIALPSVPGDRAHLFANDLAPFQAAIDEGISMIMTAHLTVPGLDNTWQYPTRAPHAGGAFAPGGFPAIATLSHEIMTNVLRDDMAFEGLIVTDALNMDAIRHNFYPADAVELTVMAGVDLPLMPDVPSTAAGIGNLVAELRERAEADPAFMARVVESVERVIAYKIDKDIFDPAAGANQPVLAESLADQIANAHDVVRSDAHLAVEQEASDRAITLMVNEEYDGVAVLPFELRGGESVYIMTSNLFEGRYHTLISAVASVAERAGLTPVVARPATLQHNSADPAHRAHLAPWLAGNVTLANDEVFIGISTFNNVANAFRAEDRAAISRADHVIIGNVITGGVNIHPNNAHSQNLNAIWSFIYDEGYGHKSAGLSLGLPYELIVLNDNYVSAQVNINARANNNVVNTERSVARPMPIYYSAIYTMFGLQNPTGKNPMDVPVMELVNGNHEIVPGEFIRRVGDGLSFECHLINVSFLYNDGTDDVFRFEGDWEYNTDVPFLRAGMGAAAARAVAVPTREGYLFQRWTTDPEGENAFIFRPVNSQTSGVPGTLVTQSMNVYAQWLSRDTAPLTPGEPEDVAAQIVAQMSFEEMLAQMFIVSTGGGFTMGQDVRFFLENASLGGMISFAAHANTPYIENVINLINDHQAATIEGSRFNIPLFTTIDQEGGFTHRIGAGFTAPNHAFLSTSMPGNMALGASANTELSRQVGYVLGQETLALGYNVNLAPTLDVNANPLNQVIGDRSFGSCPQLVSDMGAAMVEGMEASGVITTVKHFPGHGNVQGDTHFVLDVVPGTREELLALDVYPYIAAIEAGASMIMTAHLSVPGLDNTLIEATRAEAHPSAHPGAFMDVPFPKPATISREIMTYFLRDYLGFEGLTMTDALNMAALNGNFYPADTVELVIRAGIDIPLMPMGATNIDATYNMIQTLRERAEDPTDNGILLGEIRESAERIIAYKIYKDIFDPFANVQPPVAESIADRVAHASAVLRSDANLEVEQKAADSAITLAVNNEYDGTAVLPFEVAAGDVIYLLSSNNVNSRTLVGANAQARNDVIPRAIRSVIRQTGLTPVTTAPNAAAGEVQLIIQTYTDNPNVFWGPNGEDLWPATRPAGFPTGAGYVFSNAAGADNWPATRPAAWNNVFPADWQAHISNADHVIIGSVFLPLAATPHAFSVNPARTGTGRSSNLTEIWAFIEAEGYGYKSANLSTALPYEMAFLDDVYVSALVNVNTRQHTNITNSNHPVRNPALRGYQRPAPIYFSAVYAMFGLLEPTGVYPVDVPRVDEEGTIIVGEYVRRVGDGLRFGVTPTLTLAPDVVTINNERRMGITVIGGSAVGAIELDYEAPAGVVVELVDNVIVVTGVRPAFGAAAIDETFAVTVSRDEITTTLLVTVDLTPIDATLTLTPDAITIDDTNLTATVEIGGTATGAVMRG
ncbi:MAG: InlB B-repeat-containing protein, partial [Oscillospiraceae bacterium]|nr:InlB B-repeat-containing protein [Oscillospiraceae bacterium]